MNYVFYFCVVEQVAERVELEGHIDIEASDDNDDRGEEEIFLRGNREVGAA